ncbi:MAG: group 1 truncated hemoglobin [Myxococcales bacterium]|nr:group 1 truncated hemoglobin [Myxococcales bacterium]
MGTSLYDKYGGFAGISGVVHLFYAKIKQSDSLAHYFATVDMARLIDHQTQFLCGVLGGPKAYTGRGLAAAHKSLNVTPEAFAEVAAHLEAALRESGVEQGDIDTILGVVASHADEVIA